MVKRVLSDVVVGAVLAFGSQIIQYAAYLFLLLVGISAPYDTAPPDPGSNPEWLRQISLMSLVAAVPVLLVTFFLGWLIRTRGLAQGIGRGLIWAAMAILFQFVIGVANGTAAAFAALGLWAYFLAFALGPVLAGTVPARGERTRASRGTHRFAG